MHPRQIGLIINRAPGGVLNCRVQNRRLKIKGLHLLGIVPQDETVFDYDCEGKPTINLPEDSPVKKAIRE